jgi:hypothetical protein
MLVLLLLSAIASGTLGVLAFVGGMRGWRLPWEHEEDADDRGPESLDDKIARLRAAATDIRELSRDVTEEAEVQVKAAESAAATAAQNQQLASLSEEQAAAIASLLDESGTKHQRAGARTTIIWAIVGILASNVASVLLTLFFTK